MTEDTPRGLDRIWPDIERAIDRARRRDASGRLLRAGAAGAAVAALLGVVWAGVRNPPDAPPSASAPASTWDVQGVSRVSGVSDEYPLVSDGRVFVLRGGGFQKKVACLQRASGRLLWESDLSLWSCRLTADRDRVYVLARTGRARSGMLYAVSADDGTVKWACRRAVDGDEPRVGVRPVRPIVAAQGDRIVTVSRRRDGSGQMWCVSAGRREVLWRRDVRGVARMQVKDGRVFVRTPNLGVFDAASGRPLWEASVAGCGALSVVDGKVYLVDAEEDPRLVALDGRSGRALWQQPAAASCNGIVVEGNVGFVSGNDGHLRAVPLTRVRDARREKKREERV